MIIYEYSIVRTCVGHVHAAEKRHLRHSCMHLESFAVCPWLPISLKEKKKKKDADAACRKRIRNQEFVFWCPMPSDRQESVSCILTSGHNLVLHGTTKVTTGTGTSMSVVVIRSKVVLLVDAKKKRKKKKKE